MNKFYPIYLTEYEIDLLVIMLDDLAVHKVYVHKNLTDEEIRIKRMFVDLLEKIQEQEDE